MEYDKNKNALVELINSYVFNMHIKKTNVLRNEYKNQERITKSRNLLKATLPSGETRIVLIKKLTPPNYEASDEHQNEIKHMNIHTATEAYILNMQLGQHKHIVKLFRTFLSSDNELVMEMEPLKMTLHDKLMECENQRMPINDIRKYMRQLLSALSFCERKHVIHTDIKNENIMLDSKGDIKLIDFEMARIAIEEVENNKSFYYVRFEQDCNALNHKPPEVLARQPLTHAVDIFSVGVCAAVLFDYRQVPFCATKKSTLQDQMDIVNTFVGGRIPEYYFIDSEGQLNPYVTFPNTEQYGPIQVFNYMYPYSKLLEFISNTFYADPTLRPTASSALLLPFFIEDEKIEKPLIPFFADVENKNVSQYIGKKMKANVASKEEILLFNKIKS